MEEEEGHNAHDRRRGLCSVFHSHAPGSGIPRRGHDSRGPPVPGRVSSTEGRDGEPTVCKMHSDGALAGPAEGGRQPAGNAPSDHTIPHHPGGFQTTGRLDAWGR